jgi:hypothetical protein
MAHTPTPQNAAFHAHRLSVRLRSVSRELNDVRDTVLTRTTDTDMLAVRDALDAVMDQMTAVYRHLAELDGGLPHPPTQ